MPTPDQPAKNRLHLVRTHASTSAATIPQEYFWSMALDDPDPVTYSLPQAFVIEGSLDRSAFQRSLCSIVAAHEVFHTAIREVAGEVRQVVIPPEETPFELELLDRPLPETEWPAEIARTVGELVARGWDLARGRVLWARLTQLAPQTHALVVVFHHVVTDAASAHAFFRRLFELYTATRLGTPVFEQPSLQYIDAALAFAEFRATSTGKAGAAYWNECLRGTHPVQLPVALPRDAVDARRDAARNGITADPMHPLKHIKLAHDVREAVTRVAREHRVTIHGVYFAALVWLLHEETHQTDVCIETTANMRQDDAALAGIQGPLVFPTLLRVDISNCKTFRDVVPIAGHVIAEAKKHGRIPDYYRLAPHTVRRVSFNYIPLRWFHTPAREYPGLRIQPHPLPFPRWKRPWDLHLTIIDGDDALFAWTGNERLFQRDHVVVLLERYLQILGTLETEQSAF